MNCTVCCCFLLRVSSRAVTSIVVYHWSLFALSGRIVVIVIVVAVCGTSFVFGSPRHFVFLLQSSSSICKPC